MLSYAQSPNCRQCVLAAYFDEPRSERCGVCDRCERQVLVTDVSEHAWKVVRAAQHVHARGGRITLVALADLVRGLQNAQFKLADDQGHPTSAKEQLDLDALHGKVTLSRDDCECLLVQLVLDGYLSQSFQATAYTVNVYIVPGPRASRYGSLAYEEVRAKRRPNSAIVYIVLTNEAQSSKSMRQSRDTTYAHGGSPSHATSSTVSCSEAEEPLRSTKRRRSHS